MSARRKAVESVPAPMAGDALLVALAAAFRATDAAGSAFEDAALTEAGVMRTYMQGASEDHYRRRDVIEQTICCISATDLAGAMIQVEALARLDFRGSEQDISHSEDLRDYACRSIFRVLARVTGRTSADGLALELVEAKDSFVSDVAGKQAALAAYFEANGVGDLAPPPTASTRARVAGQAGKQGP